MKSRRTIEHFIELRALGKSYDEIVKKTGISKPTLIKWGKIYIEEIEIVKQTLTTKLAERIAKRNADVLNSIAESLKRVMKDKKSSEKIKTKFINRSYRRLGDIFKVKVKDVELGINSEGEIERVWISCE